MEDQKNRTRTDKCAAERTVLYTSSIGCVTVLQAPKRAIKILCLSTQWQHLESFFIMSVRPDANFKPIQEMGPAGGWAKVRATV